MTFFNLISRMIGMGTHNATQSIFFEHSTFQEGAGSRIFRMIQGDARVSENLWGTARMCQDMPACAKDSQGLPQGNSGTLRPDLPRTVTSHPRVQKEGWRLLLLPIRLLERPLTLVSLRQSEMDIFP